MGCIPFHIGLCLWKVPAVQSLSHASGVPAPFDKGAFGCTTDTGSNELQKATVRIDSGGTPPLWQGSLWVQYRYRALEGK